MAPVAWTTLRITEGAARDKALPIVLCGGHTEREPCELDLKAWGVRLPVVKAVFCKMIRWKFSLRQIYLKLFYMVKKW